jgi:hypothetical protein
VTSNTGTNSGAPAPTRRAPAAAILNEILSLCPAIAGTVALWRRHSMRRYQSAGFLLTGTNSGAPGNAGGP